MSERCALRGRQQAMPPTRGPLDDGAISFAQLTARGARELPGREIVAPPTPITEGGGYASSTNDAHESSFRQADLPEQLSDPEYEDGPFGYGNLGFDDPEAVREGPTATASSTRGDDGTGDRAESEQERVSMSIHEKPPPQQRLTAHESHALRKAGHIVWCSRCGRHAAVRLGSGLLQECRGVAAGAYPARIRRLLDNRHPISGEFL